MSDHMIGSELFQAVFQMVEKDNEDNYLLSRLKKKAEVLPVGIDSFIIKFSDTLQILLFKEIDVYYLDTYIPNLYCNGDTKETKMSGDRVIFYLNRALDLVMYGR